MAENTWITKTYFTLPWSGGRAHLVGWRLKHSKRQPGGILNENPTHLAQTGPVEGSEILRGNTAPVELGGSDYP